jgi:hypothetical protein
MSCLREEEMEKEMFCSICGELNEEWPGGDYGHNAEPVARGRCCDDCNESAVIPARIAQIQLLQLLPTEH